MKREMWAKELRIGNYINNYGKVFIIRDGEDIDDVTKGVYRQSGEFVPLTEEWLLRLGFKEVIGYTWTNEIFLLDKRKDSELNNEFYFRLFVWDSNYDLKVNVKYVHQLQNIHLDLTGEELVIKK